ncbi:MAG: hypothetical protein JXR37_24780 [Kiritimatiellae bacterium]|nr:hypothetical protein [Kiritimatiellia bacterium]
MPTRASAVTVHADRVVQPSFGGIGFHVFCHLHPMSRRQVDEVFAKRWRELSPSFARATHNWGWNAEAVLPFFRLLRETGTELYLTTWNPRDTQTAEARTAYADEVAGLLESLVRGEGLANIRTYCMTNELSLGGWAKLRNDLPTFKDYHARIFDALRARGLDVGLLASDASPIRNWDTIEWAATHMDAITRAYGGHHYINDFEPDDETFYPWFLGEVTRGVAVAAGKGKPFIVGEFGARQHRGPRYGYDKWDGCAHWETALEPLVGIQLAEAAMAMLNAGVYAMGYWTFADFPDNEKKRYANKWGTFRWSGADHSTRPHYYAYGLLTKFFRGPAAVLQVGADDPRLRAAAVRHQAGRTWSAAIVNRNAARAAIRLTAEGLAPEAHVRKYVYDPAGIPACPCGDLQPPEAVLALRDGQLTDELRPGSLTVYTTAFTADAPRAVRGLRADRDTDGVVRLSWAPNPEPDLCYYRVFRCPEPDCRTAAATQIGSTIATEFVDRDAERADGTMHYAVAAVNQSGNVGEGRSGVLCPP